MILLLASLASAQVDPRRVVILVSDDLAPYELPIDTFVQKLGVRPRIIKLHGREVVADVETAALRQAEPDVIFALGAKAAFAAHTKLPSVPMVYASVHEPARYGIEGAQVTGVQAVVPPETYLSQVTAFFPRVKKVGVIRSTGDDTTALEAAAGDVGLTLVVRKVDSPKTFRQALNALARDTDAVWLAPGRTYLTPEGFRGAVQELRRRSKPLLADSVNMVAAGAAFAVVPDLKGVGEQAAAMAVRVLDGAAPAVIPIEAPEALSTAVNLGTLRDGDIPHEALMLDFADTTFR